MLSVFVGKDFIKKEEDLTNLLFAGIEEEAFIYILDNIKQAIILTGKQGKRHSTPFTAKFYSSRV